MQPLRNNSTLTLYEKYGVEAITAVVNDCYNRLLDDPALVRYFEGVDMNVLRRHQTMFMSFLLGSKKPYNGVHLKAAHTNLNILPEDFERFVKHLDESCKHFNLDLEDRASFIAHIRTLKFFITNQ